MRVLYNTNTNRQNFWRPKDDSFKTIYQHLFNHICIYTLNFDRIGATSHCNNLCLFTAYAIISCTAPCIHYYYTHVDRKIHKTSGSETGSPFICNCIVICTFVIINIIIRITFVIRLVVNYCFRFQCEMINRFR